MALKTRTVPQSQTHCAEVLWEVEEREVENEGENILTKFII